MFHLIDKTYVSESTQDQRIFVIDHLRKTRGEYDHLIIYRIFREIFDGNL